MTIKPMLAATLEDINALRFPVLASPKLDGVRALVLGGVVYSRSLKRIPNKHVQDLFGHDDFNGLDGELIVGSPTHPDCYRTTVSGVMSEDGEPDVVFHAFDDCSAPALAYWQRLGIVSDKVQRLGSYRIKQVHHPVVNTTVALTNLEEFWLGEGFEGVMLRDPNGPYKLGRATVREGWLLKLKRFMDSEAEIVGCYEQMHNANEATVNALGLTERSTHKANKHGKGILGGFNVRDLETGVEFDIGTGFDNATRTRLWVSRDTMPGKIVKYRYFPTGSKEKPRFPTWLGFRDPIDMGE